MAKSKTYSIEKALKIIQKGKQLKSGYSIQVGSTYNAGTLNIVSAQTTVNQWLSIINGAANKASLAPGQLSYKLVDTFASIASNQSLISPFTAGPGYEFTNPPGSLGPVTVTQGLIIEAALNASLYQPITYTSATFALTSSSEAITNGGTVAFTLTAAGVPAGSEFAYVLSGLSSSLIEGGQTSGFATMGENGIAVVSVTLVDTLPFTATETLTITFPGIGKTDSVSVANTTVPFFTINADTLFGAGTATVFNAPLQPNGLGQESNTLQGTDRATGAAGVTNSLVATLIPQVTNGTGLVSSVVAIDPDTTNIQNVFLTATGGSGAFFFEGTPPVILDAYRNASWNMADVEQWWSVQSDNDLIIRDATLNTEVGMDSTARGVDYTVLFRGELLTAAPGFDAVNVVLNNVGQGEEGGDLEIGSTTASSGNIGRRGIETFNVLIGESGSYLNSLGTTGNRLTTVNVDAAPAGLGAPGAPIDTATADTVLEIDEAFEDLSTFDASGFIGQIGSLQSRAGEDAEPIDVRMEFNYNEFHAPGSTLAGVTTPSINILGGDGGNTLGAYIDPNTGIVLAFNGGAGTDDMEIDNLAFEERGDSNSISVNTGNGQNDLRINDQSTGALTAIGGVNADDFDLVNIDANTLQVNLGDGANGFLGSNIDVNTFSLVAGEGFDDLDDANDHGLFEITANSITVNLGNGGTSIDANDLSANNGSLSIQAGNGLANALDGEEFVVTNGNLNVSFGDTTLGNTIILFDLDVNNGNALFSVGEGNARIDITALDVDQAPNGGNLTITSAGGNDDVDLSNVDVDILASINLGNANNDLTIDGATGRSTFGRALTPAVQAAFALLVNTGTGQDDISISATDVTGDVIIATGAEVDTVSIAGALFNGQLVPFNETTTIRTEAGADSVDVASSTFDILTIETGSEADDVRIEDVSAQRLNIDTASGDDEVDYFSLVNPGVLNVDMGSGYDVFTTDVDLATNPLNTPIFFSNIERLVLERADASQAVDMARLNAVSGVNIAGIRASQAAGQPVDLNGLVQDIWIQPIAGGAIGQTVVDNVASDLGQNVTISNASLNSVNFPNTWTTNNGFVGDVAISTLIGEEANNRTLRVTLEAADNGNAANDSTLAVGSLDITDNSIGFVSVEVVRLTSTSEDADAQPNARNVVQFFDAYNDGDASGIELLRIVGDTDLALHIGGEDSSVGLRSTDDTVDILADSLNGDLQLVLDAGFEGEDGLGVDQYGLSDGNRADRIEANGAFDNLLALYGQDMLVNTVNLVIDPLLDNADSTYIDGFDTIQFGTDATGVMSNVTGLGLGLSLGASGLFDAIGMTPGITYDIVNTSGTLTLSNLASTVKINTSLVDDTINLSDREGDADEVLNLELYANDGVPFDWTLPIVDLDVSGFETVDIDLSAIAALSATVGFDLFLDSVTESLSFSSGGIAAGTLNIDDGDAPLPTTLRTIDVSNYEGSFVGAFNDNQKSIGASDVFFQIGDNNFTFTLTDYDQDNGDGDGTTAANFNSVFSFAADAREANVDWTITNFIASGLDLANINNWSKIDFTAIGLTEDIGVNIIDDEGDLVITAQNSDLPAGVPAYNFEIRLVGLGVFDDVSIVNDQNFIFA